MSLSSTTRTQPHSHVLSQSFISISSLDLAKQGLSTLLDETAEALVSVSADRLAGVEVEDEQPLALDCLADGVRTVGSGVDGYGGNCEIHHGISPFLEAVVFSFLLMILLYLIFYFLSILFFIFLAVRMRSSFYLTFNHLR